jgi:hypothetical protein
MSIYCKLSEPSTPPPAGPVAFLRRTEYVAGTLPNAVAMPKRTDFPSLALVALLALVAPLTLKLTLAAQTPRDGAAVLERMRDAYNGTWYHTLTFAQKTTATRRDGTTNVSTWHESLRHTPAAGVQLRIDMGDLAAGNGMLYTADSTWIVRNGALQGVRGSGNEFLPLIEGVYVQPLARTIAEVTAMKIDLSRVRSGTWRDRPVWVVGATAASDSTSPQFWVDQQRNVVVRAILRPDTATTMDIALDGYEPVGPAWLATRIVMAVNGKVIQTEEYSDWRTGIQLPASLFDVKSWTTTPHWAKK